MIKFSILGSGSKGNSVWVDVDGRQILLDCGFSFKSLRNRLANINKSTNDIREVMITHQHKDHLGAAVKRLEKGGALITTKGHFGLQHDEDCPCVGYRVEDGSGNSLVYVTDTGTIPCESLKCLMDATILILEANHDMTALEANSYYPDDLKIRVFNTHLRNEQAADLVRLVSWPGLEYVVLFHLSQKNNNKALAEYEIKAALNDAGNNKCRIIVTDQKKPTGITVVM